MLHAVRIEARHLRARSVELRCEVRRLVAFQAVCSCGWKGRWRGARSLAVSEAADHRAGGG